MSNSTIPTRILMPAQTPEGTPSIPTDLDDIMARKLQAADQVVYDNQHWGTCALALLTEGISDIERAGNTLDELGCAALHNAQYHLGQEFPGEEPVQNRYFDLPNIQGGGAGTRATPDDVRNKAVDLLWGAGRKASKVAHEHSRRILTPDTEREFGYLVGHAGFTLRAIQVAAKTQSESMPDAALQREQRRHLNVSWRDGRDLALRVGVIPTLASLHDRYDPFSAYLMRSPQTSPEIKQKLELLWDSQSAMPQPWLLRSKPTA